MKNITKGLCLAVLLSFSAGLAAQQPPPAKPTTPPTMPQTPAATMAKDDKSVTVVGCLQKGDKPNTWILTNVTGDTAAIFGTASTRPSTPGAAGTSGTAMTVTLQPTAGVNLAEHVGHQIEVIGMVVPQGRPKKDDDAPAINPDSNPPAPPIPPAANPPAPTDVVGTSGSSMDHRLNVRTVNHKADKCS